jgi:hypothetical protein
MMSATYTLYCDKCRVKHWAGQSRYLYGTAVLFLHDHFGHPLRFSVDGCEEDDDFNFRDVEYPAPQTPPADPANPLGTRTDP